MSQIKTPETNPDHAVVGKTFRAFGGDLYFCDSYDPAMGYWMRHVDAPAENYNDQHSKWRRNVSERAIGRTFHRVSS